MSDLFTTLLISFSKLLFSSRALAIMANKASSKVIHTSKAETSQVHLDCADDRGLYHMASSSTSDSGSSNDLKDLQGCLLSSFNTAPTPNNERAPGPTSLDSPTLVPYNSPAMTPAHSLAKMLHNIDMTSDPTQDSSAGSGCLSTEHSSFNISLVSDNSEEDDEFQTSASLDRLFYDPPEIPQRSSVSSAHGLGLGISGIIKKDGSGPFDGLGIVSIRASAWRSSSREREGLSDSFDRVSRSNEGYDTEGISLLADESTESLSSTFLQEALLTFTDDPFHGHTLNSIPECQSWYELDDISRRGSPITSESSAAYEARCRGAAASSPRMKGHFSSATISSELKRSLSGPLKRTHASASASRARSASWPARTVGATGAAGKTNLNHLHPRSARSSPIATSAPVWRV